ncbi:MAG TPA: MogA/MoaB family molybdenum cofactor biosynthesis protein [Candidatus Polarisedimenticolia bacterium]|nr:MogA/MoaB family molybdenum cofactor biosynthesis protein [Candidatus Polarisedimenticolia bacterium]
MPHAKHHAHDRPSVECIVVTVSDTRSPRSDRTGPWIRRALEAGGHRVIEARILPDEPRRITAYLRGLARRRSAARVIVLTGGTGLAPRDRSYEAVDALITRRLDGFGELFRMLSHRQVGSRAMLSRAVAGVFRGRILFSIPGSEAAVRLAMRRLILPELGHLAALLGEGGRPGR